MKKHTTNTTPQRHLGSPPKNRVTKEVTVSSPAKKTAVKVELKGKKEHATLVTPLDIQTKVPDESQVIITRSHEENLFAIQDRLTILENHIKLLTVSCSMNETLKTTCDTLQTLNIEHTETIKTLSDRISEIEIDNIMLKEEINTIRDDNRRKEIKNTRLQFTIPPIHTLESTMRKDLPVPVTHVENNSNGIPVGQQLNDQRSPTIVDNTNNIAIEKRKSSPADLAKNISSSPKTRNILSRPINLPETLHIEKLPPRLVTEQLLSEFYAEYDEPFVIHQLNKNSIQTAIHNADIRLRKSYLPDFKFPDFKKPITDINDDTIPVEQRNNFYSVPSDHPLANKVRFLNANKLFVHKH